MYYETAQYGKGKGFRTVGVATNVANEWICGSTQSYLCWIIGKDVQRAQPNQSVTKNELLFADDCDYIITPHPKQTCSKMSKNSQKHAPILV